MRIRFAKIDRFIISLDGKMKHLILFDFGLFNKICDKIKCLISKKKVVLQIVLIIILERLELIHTILDLLKKILTFDNVIILIKSLANKNKIKYCYNIFLEKGSYKDK